jgi:hypothetical protein
MTGTNCDFFYTQSIPVIFEPPCMLPNCGEGMNYLILHLNVTQSVS